MAVVDQAAEEAFVNKTLRKVGIKGGVNGAIAMLAATIRDHKQLQHVLTGVDGKLREEIYSAVRANLPFKPWPLDRYLAAAGRSAEARKLPTLGADGQPKDFKPAHDVRSLEKKAESVLAEAIAKRTLTLVCSRCTRQQSFSAIGDETPVAVIMKARQNGWVYDPVLDVEICPEHEILLGKVN